MLSFGLAHEQALREESKCKLYILEVVLENARLMGKRGWDGNETHDMCFVKLITTTTGKEIKVRHPL